jgi:hypothetical protein
MDLKRSFAFVLFLAIGCTSMAVRAADVVVQKDRWLSDFRNILPSLFCKDGSYFRECFKVSDDVCHTTATQATETCMRQFAPQIPGQLHQPNDGGLWGNKIGTCAGTVFEATLVKSRLNSAKCDNPELWK